MNMLTTPTFVCKLDDVPENGMRSFDVNGKMVLILRWAEQVYACDAICPHQEVSLDEGIFDGETLTCHSHLWQWKVATGEAVGLAECALKTFPAQSEDNKVFVDAPSE